MQDKLPEKPQIVPHYEHGYSKQENLTGARSAGPVGGETVVVCVESESCPNQHEAMRVALEGHSPLEPVIVCT